MTAVFIFLYTVLCWDRFVCRAIKQQNSTKRLHYRLSVVSEVTLK